MHNYLEKKIIIKSTILYPVHPVNMTRMLLAIRQKKRNFMMIKESNLRELKKQQRGETKFMEREDTRGPTLNLDFDKINFY